MTNIRIPTGISGKPWAILPGWLRAIAASPSLRASDNLRAIARVSAGQWTRGSASYGAAAVIPIRGIISHHADLMSWIGAGTSIDRLTAQFRQALADASIKTIVFDVDSPGGTVEGVPELAAEIYRSRSRKKTIAVANVMAASAAYWLASSAGELVVAPSGQVGSIGVFAIHEDISGAMEQAGFKITLIGAGKHKTDGNAFEPLSGTARADLQGKVNAFHEMFIKSVANGRHTSQDSVRGRFGQGRMVLAADAVQKGMADRAATMDQVLARISSGRDEGGGSSTVAFFELMRDRLVFDFNDAGTSRIDRAAGVPIDLLRDRLNSFI